MIDAVTEKEAAEKLQILHQTLGKRFSSALDNSIHSIHDQFATLLQVLYLRGVITAEDVKDIIAAKEIFQ